MEEKAIFKVSKNELQHQLQKVSKSVLDKSTLPIYTYILFELLENKKLNLTGSTTEIQIETSMEVIESDNVLTFCVDKSIINILKTLPEQPVTIEVTKTPNPSEETTSVTIVFSHSSGSAIIPGMDATFFEKMKETSGQSFIIPVEKLRRGLNMTRKFAGTDAMKPTQSAVFFDLKEDCITFVATNGVYMSRFKDESVKCPGCEGFIFKLDAVNISSSTLEGLSDVDVKVTSNKTNVNLSAGSLKITSRLVEGRYPNYNSIFPSDNNIEIMIDSKVLTSIINRLLIVANPLVALIKLETGMIDCSLSTSDEFSNKSAKEIVEVSSNMEITIGFSGSQMIDILSVIYGNAILAFSAPERPILIKPEINDEDCDLTLLSMPLILR